MPSSPSSRRCGWTSRTWGPRRSRPPPSPQGASGAPGPGTLHPGSPQHTSSRAREGGEGRVGGGGAGGPGLRARGGGPGSQSRGQPLIQSPASPTQRTKMKRKTKNLRKTKPLTPRLRSSTRPKRWFALPPPQPQLSPRHLEPPLSPVGPGPGAGPASPWPQSRRPHLHQGPPPVGGSPSHVEPGTGAGPASASPESSFEPSPRSLSPQPQPRRRMEPRGSRGLRVWSCPPGRRPGPPGLPP